MEALGYKLFTRAAFTYHQHWTVQRRGAAGALDTVEKGQRLADKLGFALHANHWSYFPIYGK